MPRMDASAIVAFTKKKRKEEERRQRSEAVSSSQSIDVEVSSSRPTSPERVEPITTIRPSDASPMKRARVDQPGASMSAPTSPFAGIENFKVTSPMTAFIAGNAAGLLVRSLTSYASSVGGKVVEERDSLKVEVSKLKKVRAKYKKSAKDAEAAKKRADEELVRAQSERERLIARVAELEKQVQELGEKAKEDAEAAARRTADLGQEIEELIGECVSMFEEGYNHCVGHVKFLQPDLDTSDLSFTKKVEDGKLVDAAQ